jgi:hypothetical protein
MASGERRSRRERCDPLHSPFAIRHSPAQAGGGARRTRRGSTECAARSLEQRARRTRPVCRPFVPDWIRTCSAHPDGDQQGALGPSSPDFTGSARQRSPRLLDPAVSCPAGNADVVRFAAGRGPLPSIPSCALPQRSAFARTKSGFGGIEATPAAPAAASTFQSFGALRNPPVWRRGECRGDLSRSD